MPKKHPDSVKAAAMAALLLGESVASVAKTFKIPKQTVSDWKRQAFDSLYPYLKKELKWPKINTGPFKFGTKRDDHR